MVICSRFSFNKQKASTLDCLQVRDLRQKGVRRHSRTKRGVLMRLTAVSRKIATALLGALALLTPALVAGSDASAYQSPNIWVGSPVPGTWGVSNDWSTVPPNHHKLAKASPSNDWAVDLPSGAGNAAYLYVAPSNSAYNSNVTTKVTQIIDDQACAYGGGGDLVTVGIYYNGASYGQVTYAHLDRNPGLYVGQWIGRWGTWVGNVADLWAQNNTGGSNCWTGPHVHTELRATTQYACWNRGYTYPGYGINYSNFMGFVSGPLNYSQATACP